MKIRWFASMIVVFVSAVCLFGLFTLIAQSSSSLVNSAVAATAEAPTVIAVSPSTAPNDLDTVAVITGTGFAAVPTVTLDSHVLTDVGWVSTTSLTTTVPWGLDAGVYTITVVNLDGTQGSLSNAFTVTQGIGVWTSGGPYGGQIPTITILPDDPSTLFTAAGNGGLFRSQNAGETWELVNGEVGFGPSIAVAPPEGDPPYTIYAAGGARAEEIFRSDDEGDTWQAISVPGIEGQARVFAHPTISSTVYAAYSSPGGLFVSEDRGQTWITLTQGLTDTLTQRSPSSQMIHW